MFRAAAIAAATLVLAGSAPAAGPVWVTLGTGGGPIARLERAQPANAVVVDGAVYLFDVGDGVQLQLAKAGLPLSKVKAVFVSHHHYDHDAGLGPLIVGRWLFNSYAPLPVIGSPGTRDMVRELAAAFRPVELAPITIGGSRKPGIAATVAAQDLAADIDRPQPVYSDGNVRVLAIGNDHFHFAGGSAEALASRSYAFRVEARGRSIVYTGDTGPSSRVELLARGADLLVSEVIDLPAMRSVLAGAPDLPPAALAPMLAHMERDHLTPRQVGELATRAGVKAVVLTHIAPGRDGDSDAALRAGVAQSFSGPITVARDIDKF